MDRRIVDLHKIPINKLPFPIKLRTIDGGPRGTGQIEFCTKPHHMQVSSLHHKRIFLFSSSANHGYINTIPVSHGPTETWSDYCKNHGLSEPILHVASTFIESPDTPDITKIPSEYHAYLDVFSKVKASGLPTHREYDCAIYSPARRLPGDIFTYYHAQSLKPWRIT